MLRHGNVYTAVCCRLENSGQRSKDSFLPLGPLSTCGDHVSRKGDDHLVGVVARTAQIMLYFLLQFSPISLISVPRHLGNYFLMCPGEEMEGMRV